MKSLVVKLLCAVSLLGILASVPADAAQRDPLKIAKFNDKSGLDATEAEVQETWTALKAMGTTEFVGGTIGNFRLDESAMVAGAMAIGVTEFDNYLRTGTLATSSSNSGAQMTTAMTSSSGLDLSYLIGSFLSGGTSPTGSALGSILGLLTTTGATAAGQCDPAIAAKQVAVGIGGVNTVVTAGLSPTLGFSQNSAIGGSTTSTGFATTSCLDNLFQNAGANILFTPPSLGSLMTSLQGWSCPMAVSVAAQVMGQWGDMSMLNTASMGGFFPAGTFGEANESTSAPFQPGIGNLLSLVFGTTFSPTETTATADSSLSSINSVFK